MSLRQAFRLMDIHPSVYYYKPKPNEDHLVREQLSELASVHSQWGFWMMHSYLRNLHLLWNHKRVYRIYTEMRLNMRRKYKKRLPVREKEPLKAPDAPNKGWAMDFMHDSLMNGVKFRTFNIIDEYNREALNITMDTSLTSKRVIKELDKLIAWRGAPAAIRVDNGPEFIAYAIQDWLQENKIKVIYIEPGAPWENGHIESFHDKLRDECLNREIFGSLLEAKIIVESWRVEYNTERPHSSLGNKTPEEFAGRATDCSRLRSGFALPPSRTISKNINHNHAAGFQL